MSQVSYVLLFQETKSPCAVTRETKALRTRKEATPVTIFVYKTIQKQATKKKLNKIPRPLSSQCLRTMISRYYL